MVCTHRKAPHYSSVKGQSSSSSVCSLVSIKVWCKGNIPKNSFIVWVTAWNRLSTRDKLRRWGLVVPVTCLLCGSSDETWDYLLFSCFYSSELWNYDFSQSNFTPPIAFEDVLSWVRTASINQKLKSVVRWYFRLQFEDVSLAHAVSLRRSVRLQLCEDSKLWCGQMVINACVLDS